MQIHFHMFWKCMLEKGQFNSMWIDLREKSMSTKWHICKEKSFSGVISKKLVRYI